MNTNYMLVGLAIVIIIAGALWYTTGDGVDTGSATQMTADTSDFGTYPYTCDNGASFTMSPSLDVSTIKLDMVAGAPFGTVTLAKASAESGVRYEGGEGLVFEAKGETVTITSAGAKLTCKPVQNPDEAPFNFGD